MHSAFDELGHRPWPVPARPWVWRQSWCDLLFAHWRVAKEQLRPLVPPSLEIQECDGSSWIGVVPFRMEGVSRRFCPDIPGVSAFPELNLRLYVEHEGRPGVWFLSLDAAKRFAVFVGRRFFHLPYKNARIVCRRDGQGIRFHSTRSEPGESATFSAAYEPRSEHFRAEANSVEHFLTERYCLFAQDSAGAIHRTEVHHAPWSLQRARLEIESNSLGATAGIELRGEPDHLLFARRLDVVVWNPDRVADRI